MALPVGPDSKGDREKGRAMMAVYHRQWRLLRASRLHTDRMLAWLTLSVGVAIYSLPSLLNAVGGGDHGLRLSTLFLPWIAALLLALLARLVAKFHRDANDKFYLDIIGSLSALILRWNVTNAVFGEELLRTAKAGPDDLKKSRLRVKRSGVANDIAYWSAWAIAFGGLVYVVERALGCAPAAPFGL
jgi:hypothetical protein